MTTKYGWHRLTLAILDHLQKHGRSDTHNISSNLDISYPNAGIRLLGLYRKGWVNREAEHLGEPKKPRFHYFITPQGRKKLSELQTLLEKKTVISFA